jgi:hypothetical protein
MNVIATYQGEPAERIGITGHKIQRALTVKIPEFIILDRAEKPSPYSE